MFSFTSYKVTINYPHSDCISIVPPAAAGFRPNFSFSTYFLKGGGCEFVGNLFVCYHKTYLSDEVRDMVKVVFFSFTMLNY